MRWPFRGKFSLGLFDRLFNAYARVKADTRLNSGSIHDFSCPAFGN
jgi:hypothetical protein